MSHWRKVLIVALLVLSLPVQSFAAVSMKCVIAGADAGKAPLPYVEHDTSEHHRASHDVAIADDNDSHHHGDSRHAHSCSTCASGCCFGIALPAVAAVMATLNAVRVVAPFPPPAGAVSFLTGGIERPPRRTLIELSHRG